MLLAQISAFVEVARRRSVSRAAEALFVTQPALTARLQGLERDLGARLFVRTPSYHELTSAFFRRAGLSPAGIMELDNIDAAKKMVEQGFGVALLPHTSIGDEIAAGTLAEVTIRDAEPVRRQIVAVRRKDSGRPT